MDLSILIPTHNRPNLFNRCLASVLKYAPNTEIIVNNDSNDIEEFKHDNIKYFYEKFDNLTDIYKFLFEQSTGKYIYYLEDDDYLSKDFLSVFDNLKYDIITGGYVPAEMKYLGTRFKVPMLITDINYEYFQLSQVIFKRELVTFSDIYYKYCNGNCIYIDYFLYELAKLKAQTSKHLIQKLFFVQTDDGHDNISFKEYTNLDKCKGCVADLSRFF